MDIPDGVWLSLYADSLDEFVQGRTEAHGRIEVRVRPAAKTALPLPMEDMMSTAPAVLRMEGVDVVLGHLAQPQVR